MVVMKMTKIGNMPTNEPRYEEKSVYAKTKTQISYTAELIGAFVFAARIV